MTGRARFAPAMGGDAPSAVLCDAWTIGGRRSNGAHESYPAPVIGRWPIDRETDAAVRLADAVGTDASWEELAAAPAIAQKLGERAQLQPLDREILRHIQHLQHVCHRPRLHLRVEDERVPVARARRSPARAVADLVSHPGDWEHRTLRSIQPRRVLARQVEDEWNLYENRVAVRLVDRLLTYLAGRLEELMQIERTLEQGKNHGDHAKSSPWRAKRIMTLWAESLDTGTEDDLRVTLRRLAHAQRKLQALTDLPLYHRIPPRATAPLALQQTNILVNDPHYRKVAALWRAWARHGYKKQETRAQREQRRQAEAHAWDRYVLHLVARGMDALGWSMTDEVRGRIMRKPGWSGVRVATATTGSITLHAESGAQLAVLPLCAVLEDADGETLEAALSAWDDGDIEVVGVHVGAAAANLDTDRATGWRFGARAVVLACSPWTIDSEERMARLLHGWLARHATAAYPQYRVLRGLPSLPDWDWLAQSTEHLVALRAPRACEREQALAWRENEAKKHAEQARRAKVAKRAFPSAPRIALERFSELVDVASKGLEGLETCPVCGTEGDLTPRLGRRNDGSDTTWWATCPGCQAEWGLRPCASCGDRYRVLFPAVGTALRRRIGEMREDDWPDRALGRDVWAQPCRTDVARHARCPSCGACSGGSCKRCELPAGP